MAERKYNDVIDQTWDGCYDDGWKGVITPEAFAHPAKFARGLIQRIIEHGLERGCWRKGDLVGDPFGGIGTGGIVAAYFDLRWVGVELEPRFVAMARANFAAHAARWQAGGHPAPVMVQGDSRRFAEILRERAGGVVTSPPYVSGGHHDDALDSWNANGRGQGIDKEAAGYGKTAGQIGRLAEGDLGGVVTSPPFLGNLPNKAHEKGVSKAYLLTGANPGSIDAEYGDSPGQIAAMREGKVDGVVTSPPWENQEPSHAQNDTPSKGRLSLGGRSFLDAEYGESSGQVGKESGETYWQAMAAVYAECFKALRPGGVMAVVVKDYVKKGKRQPLCDNTAALLESLGFVTVERVGAMLVQDDCQPGLFEKTHTKRKERKSFFRRLAEKKGSPHIDFEEVIFGRRG